MSTTVHSTFIVPQPAQLLHATTLSAVMPIRTIVRNARREAYAAVNPVVDAMV